MWTCGWKSHGAVVDAVSSATLRQGAEIGLHHLSAADEEGGGFVVTRARGGERITPAFSSKSRPTPTGDLIYGMDRTDGHPGVDPFAGWGAGPAPRRPASSLRTAEVGMKTKAELSWG